MRGHSGNPRYWERPPRRSRSPVWSPADRLRGSTGTQRAHLTGPRCILVIRDRGLVNFCDPNHFRRAVPGTNGGLHRRTVAMAPGRLHHLRSRSPGSCTGPSGPVKGPDALVSRNGGTQDCRVAEADGNRTRLPALAGTPVLKTGGPTRRPDASPSRIPAPGPAMTRHPRKGVTESLESVRTPDP